MWPNIVIGSVANSKRVSRAVARGMLRPIALNLYTPDLQTPVTRFVKDHWQDIVAALVPDAVMSFRTALEAAPAPDGSVFLVGPSRYERELPGLRIRVAKGAIAGVANPHSGDAGAFASRAQALLDAARPTRKRAAVARGLSEAEIEHHLRASVGEIGALLALHAEMGQIAPALGAERELRVLTRIINRLTGNAADWVAALIGDASVLAAPERVFGPDVPFAEHALMDTCASARLAGVSFTDEQSRGIIRESTVPVGREGEAAVLVGMHAILGSRAMMARGITDGERGSEIVARLDEWHLILTDDVAQAANRDELARGLELLMAIEHPLRRAAGLHALVIAARPFASGNGRLARALMSAELLSSGEGRLIIPPHAGDAYRAAWLALRERRDARAMMILYGELAGQVRPERPDSSHQADAIARTVAGSAR